MRRWDPKQGVDRGPASQSKRRRSRRLAALICATAALAAGPVIGAGTAQADPHPGQSVNVAIVANTSCVNGGSFPTTTSGPTGSFADFTFTDLGVSAVNAASLASFDTVLLNICSGGADAFGCNVNNLSASQQTDVVNFLNGGGKLIIYDSECPPQNYSWLPFPFTTSNPGALGGTGTVNIVERNLLGTDTPGDPHFIDEVLLGEQTDAVGDMNVLTTTDPNICLQMSGTNAANQSGATHVYYQSGGVLLYNGFDIDVMSTGTSPDASTPPGNVAKIWLQELQQPRNGEGLACAVSVVGISLTPREATNPVGTSHTVTATRTDESGNPLPGALITFQVNGANAGATGTCNPADCVTDANGQVTFTYTGTTPGEDEITACFTPASGGDPVCAAPAKKTWTGQALSAAQLELKIAGRKNQKVVGPQVSPAGKAKNAQRKVLSAKVTCLNAPCTVKLKATAKSPGEKTKFKSANISLQQGETKKVRLTATSKQQLAELKAALKAGEVGKAKIKGVATSPAGVTDKDNFKVKLRGR